MRSQRGFRAVLVAGSLCWLRVERQREPSFLNSPDTGIVVLSASSFSSGGGPGYIVCCGDRCLVGEVSLVEGVGARVSRVIPAVAASKYLRVRNWLLLVSQLSSYGNEYV